MNRDAQTFVTVAASKVVATVASLLLTALVGRTLGPAGLGQWVLLVAAATFLHTTIINWTHGGTVRFGCEEWVRTGTLRRTLSARVPLVATSLLVGGALLMFRPFDWPERVFGIDRSYTWLVVLYALSLWIAAEAQNTMQALTWLRLQAVTAAAGSMVMIAVIGVLLLMPGYRTLPIFVMAAATVSTMAWTAVWVWVLVRARVAWELPSRGDIARQLRYSGPMLAGFAVGYVATWGDHVLLRHLSSIEQVGYFGLANTIFLTMFAAAGILPTLVLPRLVAAETLGGDAARRYLSEAVPTIFVLWSIAMALAVLVVPLLLRLLGGPRFAPAFAPLVVLCAVLPAGVITSLYTALFSLQERNGRVLAFAVMMTLTNLLVSVALIPRFGATGSAIGTAASYVVIQALYVADQHRHVRVDGHRIWAVWAILLASGALQIVAGGDMAWRLLWVIASVVAIGFAARRLGAVSGPLVERLFGGRLAPVGALVTWSFVAPVVGNEPDPIP